MQQSTSTTQQEAPIFSARGVDWPLPTILSPQQYRKYRKESYASGSNNFGIMNSGLRIANVTNNGNDVSGNVGDASVVGLSTSVHGDSSNSIAGCGSSTTTGDSSSNNAGSYGGLTGLMGRVLGASSTTNGGVGLGSYDTLSNDIEEIDLSISATRPVLPPRQHCVAVSNGWFVGAVECSYPLDMKNTMSSSGFNTAAGNTPQMQQQHQYQSKQGLITLIPPLRLLSRWNIRRGTTSIGSEGNLLVPLPPPVRPNVEYEMAKNDIINNINTDPNFGRIMHTFVDPTGCHVLLSALNGEAYYIHSTSKSITKLYGFGPNSDRSYSGYKPGVPFSESSSGDGIAADDKAVQTGLTPGSYVTAVGWDGDRGTEGSTKHIVIGTSFGELYEYVLISPNATTTATSGKSKSACNGKAGEVLMDDRGNVPIDAPVLLSCLNTTISTSNSLGSAPQSQGREGGSVGGILFQRVIGGVGIATSTEGGGVSGGSAVVLVSTCGMHRHTRLHSFSSQPSATSSLGLRSAFAHGFNRTLVELPGSIDCAALCSCNDGSFAMQTETGMYYGATGTTNISGSTIDVGILTHDKIQHRSDKKDMTLSTGSLSIGLTPHHFIVLSSVNDVKFINRVAKTIIQEERVDWLSVSQSSDIDLRCGGATISAAELITDTRRPDQIWLRKGRSLVHISSSNEGRDAWKYTLIRSIETIVPTSPRTSIGNLTSEEKHIECQFEHAKSLCNNSTQIAVVNAVRSEYYLSKGRVEPAAVYMAHYPSAVLTFSDTAVRLALPMIGGDNSNILPTNNSDVANEALGHSNMALIAFLTDKVKVAKSKNDNVVCTVLGTWLTELHLQEREKGNIRRRNNQNQQLSIVNTALFHQFLSSFVGDMDPKTIIKVLASHDVNSGECTGYSAAARDIGAAVNASLGGEQDEKNGALDALRVLNESPIEKAEPYYYKYALALLSCVPTLASKSFASRFSEGLSEIRLLSAFMQYEKRRKSNDNNLSSFVDDSNASICYMEGVIELGSKSRAIFNYTASLYAALDDEEPLFRFISKHVPVASSLASPVSNVSISNLLLSQSNEERNSPLDKAYALRVIMRTGRHFRSAVKLYMGFGMRQQAVELALKVDPSLARGLARQSVDKDEMKRLWLLIARNAAANDSSSNDGKEVVTKVVMVLKDCGPEVLSIEDALPFLPDFAQIDQFKDEISDALSSYSSNIEHYLKEMNECDQTCDTLRDELLNLKNNSTTRVRADARCALTNKPIFGHNGSFYVFPSGYAVLEAALKQEILPYLNGRQARRVKHIEKELARLNRSIEYRASSYYILNNYFETEELQAELNGLIAAECPLTGSLMVDSIDEGFGGYDDHYANIL